MAACSFLLGLERGFAAIIVGLSFCLIICIYFSFGIIVFVEFAKKIEDMHKEIMCPLVKKNI